MITLSIMTIFMTGCIRPFQKPIIEEIAPNETAFLITLEGGKQDQARFASIDFLEESKIASKRVEIPTRWLQTGRFRNQGQWIPTQRLIKVDRTPVARRWTVESDTGTSAQRQYLSAESRDSIGVSSGFAITAYITEEDTAKFLYRYPNGNLARIIDQQIFNDVQSVYAEVAARFNVSQLREEKEEINNAIRERVLPLYASHGITISPNIGLIGGLYYDNVGIQKAIDDVFIAQNLQAKEEARRLAQEVENSRILSIEETDAARRKVRADAQAYEIERVTQAIADGGEAYLDLRRLEAMVEAIQKWNGQTPTTVAAGGSNVLPHMFLNKME